MLHGTLCDQRTPEGYLGVGLMQPLISAFKHSNSTCQFNRACFYHELFCVFKETVLLLKRNRKEITIADSDCPAKS